MKKRHVSAAIAGLLVVAMVVNTAYTATLKVSLSESEEETPQGYATNYLAGNSEYLTEDVFSKMGDVLKAYKTPSSWNDYYDRAEIEVSSENYEGALKDYQKAIDKYDVGQDSTLSKLYLKLACVQIMLKDNDKAIKNLKKSISYDKEQSGSYLMLAQMYIQKEDTDKTLKYLEKYVRLVDADLNIDKNGHVTDTAKTTDISSGQADSKQAIYDVVSIATLEATIGQLYLGKSQYAIALNWLNHSITHEETANAHYYAGLCWMQLGQPTTAIGDLDMAVKLDDSIKELYYYRGIAKIMASDFNGARKDLKKEYKRTEDEKLKKELKSTIESIDEALNSIKEAK